ncbi:Thioredoxin domain [Trinorchestia longiramus]|nr:Thioredoxin domain [Trinorchestia longiramus]
MSAAGFKPGSFCSQADSLTIDQAGGSSDPGPLNLEVVTEGELQQLVKDEKYVLVLFSRGEECTGSCKKLEQQLLHIREEIVEALGAWVIRCHAPDTLTKWGGSQEADTIIFVRHNKPMIVAASTSDEDEFLNYLLASKESNVRSLNDATFEHETQASTGATTGDWLVVFTREGCGAACERVLPHVETAAANLRGRKNVALVLREADAAVTTRRFEVTDFPTAILFRLGRMYRFPLVPITTAALTGFAEEGFRNARAEEIPKPKTPFDDVTQAIADWLRENPYQFLGGVAGSVIVVLVLVLLNSPPPQSWTKHAKKKKK